MKDKYQYCDCNDCKLRKKIVNIIPSTATQNTPLLICRNGQYEHPLIQSNEFFMPNAGITYIMSITVNYMHLTHVDISHNKINVLPEILSVQKLNCVGCGLTNLPASQPCLEKLNCSNNTISTIPRYPSLTHLNCSKNLIENIPNMLNLRHLVCSENPITSIKLDSLIYLESYKCPILVSHKIPSLYRRSSYVENAIIKWSIIHNEKIEINKLVINWNNNTGQLPRKSRFWTKLERFLFNNTTEIHP